MPRKPIPKGVRFEIFKRDLFTCQYCGAHPPGVLLHIDHIVAVAQGGTNDQDNLVTACQACNIGKGAKDLKQVPDSLKEQAMVAAEKEAQLLGYQQILEAKRQRIEEEKWRVAEILEPGCSENGTRRDWLSAISRFIERLGVHEVMDSADIAVSRFPYSKYKAFRYFCGVCWRKIKETENAAV